MADLNAQMRQHMAAAGEAMPGGRFPIGNRADLENAIRAVGRVQPNTEAARSAVRRFIIRRAQELGLSDLIPDTWNADGTLKTP
ncbi:MAG TPA: hypothetical protein VF223_04795 [Trebonia sp.]